ncbi:ATP-dependent nuclease subunit B [Streptococcus sciuri]|uniref:ATP-dependent helicase/deoxyribonuclease subunit B n=1 Tax=Streptococcus sciuri TaxID=2973939 RepID=A0ABT2F5N7_9STRE|nr:ATP-dependent nuclease subunit B [Streptococcus sciuri]MCS4487700.1 ATP-dependent nuclease subunit B [Streptococcus sciuri]
MELLYTDISHDMTEILVKRATQEAKKGKRVFYIAPNSLSFEKEREVLWRLEEQSSFAITVTRFAQLARYFVLNSPNPKETLDDAGLAMIFYCALRQLEDKDLRVYARLKGNHQFIRQLVDLYKELQAAQLTVHNLELLHSKEKYEDLVTIFSQVESLLQKGQYDNQSKLAFFADQLKMGYMDKALEHVVLVIDGFTRFSAEEETLIHRLEERCDEIIIGTYLSQKAQRSAFSMGNIYQASLDFIRDLASQYKVKPQYIESHWQGGLAFKEVSQLFESNHDFTASGEKVSDIAKSAIEIWECVNQQEEIEQVAHAIRQKLHEGHRYKDILVLLGDVESYHLQIGQIFERYAIPYYLGKSESMSAHPLINLIESLERIKRYNFRADDVMNLLKSGLYGRIEQADLDYFDQYVTYADIKGQKGFLTDFTASEDHSFNLERLNGIRNQIIQPLARLIKSRKQSGKSLLRKLFTFFVDISLTDNMERFAASLSEIEREKEEQVWKTFTSILQQFQTIFGDEKLTLDECLSLISNGLLQAEYRMVPATVDVVSIKSYDLVEPHSKPFVFVLGMTKSHFPKIAQNKSLVSDEERQLINEQKEIDGHFDIISREHIKKNHFTALSLFNVATTQLILSQPQVLNENEDDMSPYLRELVTMGVPLLVKKKTSFSTDGTSIGTYKALLSRLVGFANDSPALYEVLDKQEETFWSVLVRHLRQKLDKEGLHMPLLKDTVITHPVSKEVMAVRFPPNEALHLSSSALTTFYNNQYQYFLRYVLRLKERESIHPDARHHGTYLHRVFELVMKDCSSDDFDDKLNQAIKTANNEEAFQTLYGSDAQGRYILGVLEDIVRATATIFNRSHSFNRVQMEEESFELLLSDKIVINGIIDRVDRLSDGTYGVVDYKSSKQVFDIEAFFNGLSPQLITYLSALQSRYHLSLNQIFGAMYLHMQEPKLSLDKVTSLDELQAKAHQEIIYRGLFLEKEKVHLANGNYKLDTLFSEEELAIMLGYNERLYQKAKNVIRSGHFLINPYTKDGKVALGEQIKAITGFEADRHMPYSRRLYHLPRKEKHQGFLTLMAQSEEDDSDEV